MEDETLNLERPAQDRDANMGWIFLIMAGVLEVGFTTTLRLLIKTPSSIALNLIFIVLIIASFTCLQQAVKTVPLGTGYAVWTGIGAVGTVIVGGLFFNESLPPLRIVLIGLIIVGVVGLKLIEH
jgi:quaternary ammonium compound-resistance protein SugE